MGVVEEKLGRKGRPWTSKPKLPGGDFPTTGFEDLLAKLQADYPWLEPKTLLRLAHQFGTNTWMVLGTAQSLEDLGRDFGSGLSEAEVRYLAVNEWAATADDVLWRRTKMGLKLTEKQAGALQLFIEKEI